MLENLDTLNWETLKTSFGKSAINVPQNIRDLLSDSEYVRELAIENLHADLCNTYIVGTATLAAVPYLIELLQAEKTQDKHNIMRLLWEASLVSVEAKNSWKKIEWQVSKAIADGLSIYIRLLKHQDTKVRLAAIKLVVTGHFPISEWKRIDAVYTKFKKREKQAEIRQYFDQWDKRREVLKKDDS